MRVAAAFADLSLDRPALLTIGTFDGVHRGHRFLLEQAQQRAQEHGYGLVVCTFDPCPAVVLRPGLRRYQLTTAAQKLRLLESIGPAAVLLLPFTLALSRLSAGAFMDELESRLTVREMWLGEDFHFGRDRSGGLPMLVERGRASGFSLHVVARRMEDSTSISSTRIRQALAAGDVAAAMPLLGYPFALDLEAARVTPEEWPQGPAAIVEVPEHLAMPGPGVYAAVLRTAGPAQHAALVRVGQAPDDAATVWPFQPATGVEFIDRLGADARDREDLAELLPHAQRMLAAWERPHYPASGTY